MKGKKQASETTMNAKAVKLINEMPQTFVRKRYSGPFRKGLPDITGISHGYPVEIEGKLHGNKLTLIQEKWQRQFKELGAITGVYHTPQEAVEIIKNGLREKIIASAVEFEIK